MAAPMKRKSDAPKIWGFFEEKSYPPFGKTRPPWTGGADKKWSDRSDFSFSRQTSLTSFSRSLPCVSVDPHIQSVENLALLHVFAML